MADLHGLTTQLISCTTFTGALHTVLDAVMELHRADFGNIQLYRPERHAIEIAAQRGFGVDFLKAFDAVSVDDPCACGRALRLKTPILIEDIDRDAEFAPYIEIAHNAGFRAVQSTPLIAGDGEVVGVLSTHFREPRLPSDLQMHVTSLFARQAAEILKRLDREERQQSGRDIVARELDHRLKNVLTMIQAIARQSLKSSSELGEFADRFEARLAALARAHAVLSRGDWRRADIRSLLREQLAGLGEGRILLEGPDFPIDADAAYVAALLVHELAVNAHKHGALGADRGRATLTWARDPAGPSLRVVWAERGGPEVRPPTSVGFGTALLRSLVRSGLMSGETRYEPAGVVCEFQVPLKDW